MLPKDNYSGCTISQHQCKCFDMLSDAEKTLLEANSVKVNYKKGEVICKQGALATHIMYMEQGLAKVYLDDGQNSLVLKIVPEGNMLGLSSVNAENNTYQYSSMTYIDSVIKQIDMRVIKQLLGQNPAFAQEIINILGSNSVQINGRFFCLTHKQSYGRLADILLCLSERIFRKYQFELPLSRKDLAELSGLSPETVIRMLKKFNEDGLIKMEGKNFNLLDPVKLKRISVTG